MDDDVYSSLMYDPIHLSRSDTPVDVSDPGIEWTLDRFAADDPEAKLIHFASEEFWENLPAIAAMRPGQMLAGIFPPILQMERTFSVALNRIGLPALTIAPHQRSILPALARGMPIGIVVSLFGEKDTAYPSHIARLLILAPHERPAGREMPGVMYEMQLVPGLTVLMQCAYTAGSSEFHTSDRFIWEFDNKRVFLTDGSSNPRFKKVALPGTYETRKKMCRCGQSSITAL